jgi:hypothetical protein
MARGDICVIEAQGQTANGVLFYVATHKFLFLADETTPSRFGTTRIPRQTARSFHNALAMLEVGARHDRGWTLPA